MKINFILLSGLILILSACGQQNDSDNEENDAPQVVKTFTVSTQEHYVTRQFIGEVVALSTVELSFQVPGRLTELPVRQGRIVPQGELIAALDDTDYRIAVRSAEADLVQAQADARRKRNLVERGAVSGIERDVAEANLIQAQAQLDAAERDLSHTRLTAPFDAMVSRRLVDAYSMVSPEAPVVIIQDISELRIRTHLPESFFESLVQSFADEERASARQRGEFDAALLTHPDQRYPLVYREHVTQSDPTTQTYEVEFAFAYEDSESTNNPPPLALPGMVTNVRIRIPLDDDTFDIRVPLGALKSHAEGEFSVFVLNDSKDQVRQVAVEINQLSANHAHISNGLEGGEIIVAAGAHQLEDGAAVKLMDEAL